MSIFIYKHIHDLLYTFIYIYIYIDSFIYLFIYVDNYVYTYIYIYYVIISISYKRSTPSIRRMLLDREDIAYTDIHTCIYIYAYIYIYINIYAYNNSFSSKTMLDIDHGLGFEARTGDQLPGNWKSMARVRCRNLLRAGEAFEEIDYAQNASVQRVSPPPHDLKGRPARHLPSQLNTYEQL